ncbi:TetR/AcrR family transcriptional regulator [Vibrio sp. ZSDZ34]|uniref:TetR/AcrR family transcriptional regulator n=1 Tax=Vibrio gelatinilyticus TaxID=2893468 RepID=A0A9X1WA75_9VIBR|nr:TetR/AcrR family transcriptional regulator [Vibrio gelatinilyticus]MCJ2376341.1 TetR/AcrR family transcriptional regulator [Vibrio gelatinilyticus]
MKRAEQVEHSRRVLAEALFRLFKRYDYDKITISQIASEANVARNTFYRNFSSIEDILIYMFESSIEDALKTLSSPNKSNSRTMVEWRVQFARKHPYFAYIQNQPKLWLLVEKYCQENQYRIFELIEDLNSSTADPFDTIFEQAGMNAVLGHWVQSDFERDEKSVVDFIYSKLRQFEQ